MVSLQPPASLILKFQKLDMQYVKPEACSPDLHQERMDHRLRSVLFESQASHFCWRSCQTQLVGKREGGSLKLARPVEAMK